MRRISTTLVVVAVLTAATPTFAQDAPSPGFGALVGGLVGGAIDAATAGRRPRAGDLVPGGGGEAGHKGGGHAGGGEHRQAQAGGGEHKAPQAGGGGQVRRKPGK